MLQSRRQKKNVSKLLPQPKTTNRGWQRGRRKWETKKEERTEATERKAEKMNHEIEGLFSNNLFRFFFSTVQGEWIWNVHTTLRQQWICPRTKSLSDLKFATVTGNRHDNNCQQHKQWPLLLLWRQYLLHSPFFCCYRCWRKMQSDTSKKWNFLMVHRGTKKIFIIVYLSNRTNFTMWSYNLIMLSFAVQWWFRWLLLVHHVQANQLWCSCLPEVFAVLL